MTPGPASLRILVTAGPTREYVDDVRYLSNASSGRMGFAVARAAVSAGHETVLVCGPTPLPPPEGPELVPVVSALEMRDAVREAAPGADAVVAVAAVADYRPETRIPGKRKKGDGPWHLRHDRTPDSRAGLGAEKGARFLVVCAIEAEDGERNARRKLLSKNLDLIVLNAPSTVGAEESDFVLLYRDGRRECHMSVPKQFLAQRLVSLIEEAKLVRDR